MIVNKIVVYVILYTNRKDIRNEMRTIYKAIIV